MKTATVTWIYFNNYGTELQAYALQTYIKSLGYSNRILADEEMLKAKWKTLSRKAPPAGTQQEEHRKRSNNRFIRLIKKIYHICKRKIYKRVTAPYTRSQERFEQFKEQVLELDYSVAPESVDCLDQKYDAFICGSDQIWSLLDKNINGYYYLDFTSKIKIAYAPSFGKDRILDSKAPLVKAWLSDFYSLSVREVYNVAQLSDLVGKTVAFVCDPTLLFDSFFWSDFCSGIKKPASPYLLCYFLENKPWYFEYAKEMAKALHLKLILVPSRIEHTKQRFCFRKPVGPKEFVSLFEGAGYVLTDSYHGSIFALLFSKQFLCIKRFSDSDSDNQNSRIFSLFHHLGIEHCVISDKQFEQEDLCRFDYDSIQEQISAFRNSSKNYLESNLKEIEHSLGVKNRA